ncbi:MAG: ABC transporter permease, partial [Acidobacteria bacterium]|nr:ABC transporter permease [Acidobacteriota bacterium]
MVDSFVQQLRQHLRYARRTAWRNPGFTAVVVFTLALGIGADAAIFLVVNGVLLKPLPFREPQSLCLLYDRTSSAQRASVSYPNFLDWQRTTQAFASLAAFRRDNMILSGGRRPERLRTAMVSAGFLATLGVEPILGREFQASEDTLGGANVALVSESFWRTRYSARNTVLGSALDLNGSAYEVVGVVPDAVRTLKTALFTPSDIFVPLGQWRDPSFRDRKVTTGLSVIGRLAPGASENSAAAEMSHIAANLAAAFPDTNRDVGVTVISLRKQLLAAVEPMLYVLLGAVTFVLLIACTNVANLMLARATARMKEFATRSALGAGWTHLALQMLIEAIFLASMGGLGGIFLAAIGARAAKALIPRDVPRLETLAVDSHVLMFVLLLSIAAGILVGLAPTVKIFRLNLNEALKSGGRGSSSLGRGAQTFFVIGEVSIALVLLVGAGLMIRTIENLLRVRPGFDPHNVLVFDVSPSPVAAADPLQLRAVF